MANALHSDTEEPYESIERETFFSSSRKLVVPHHFTEKEKLTYTELE
jgi:hypothetical protein